jgi:hypothetical protein
MEGREPSQGVPAPGQDLREIFQTGAGLLDPKSLSSDEIEKRGKEVEEAAAKVAKAVSAIGPELEKCQKEAAKDFGQSFDSITGQLDSGNCGIEDLSEGQKSSLSEMIRALGRTDTLPQPLVAEFNDLQGILQGVLTTRRPPPPTTPTTAGVAPVVVMSGAQVNCSSAISRLISKGNVIDRAIRDNSSSSTTGN